MVANTCNVFNNCACLISNRQPVDVTAFGRARALTDVGESISTEMGSFKTLCQEVTHQFAGEEFHSAISVMDHKPLGCSKKLVGNH